MPYSKCNRKLFCFYYEGTMLLGKKTKTKKERFLNFINNLITKWSINSISDTQDIAHCIALLRGLVK